MSDRIFTFQWLLSKNYLLPQRVVFSKKEKELQIGKGRRKSVSSIVFLLHITAISKIQLLGYKQ